MAAGVTLLFKFSWSFTNAIFGFVAAEAEKTSLRINTGKTEILRINTNGKTRAVRLQQEEIKEVGKFTYLGSVVSKDGGADEDIKSRISKARHVFRTLTPSWRSSALSLQHQRQVSHATWLRNVAHNKDQQKQITNVRHRPTQQPEHQVARNHLKRITLGKHKTSPS